MDAIKPIGGGVASKTAIYNKIAAKEEKILSTLFSLLDHGNESVRLGAAKVLVNKIVPDLKSLDIPEGSQLKVLVITKEVQNAYDLSQNPVPSSISEGEIQSS